MNLTDQDLAQFSRLGITPALLEAAGIKRVTDREARDEYGIKGSGDMSGILFPYFDPSTMTIGNCRRWYCRIRRDHPEVDADGRLEKKYVAPYGDRVHSYFPPVPEWFADPSIPIIFVESEKSALSLTAWCQRTGRKYLVIALGGVWSWHGKVGIKETASGERVPDHGAIADINIARDGRKTFVLFDANTANNLHVQAARRDFVKQLRRQGADVCVLDLPQGKGINGPDDFIGLRGDEAFGKVLDGAVDGAQLLDEIVNLFKEYFHFSNQSQAIIVALWIAHTYVYNLFPWTPYLAVTSPTKRCGKSLLLELLGYLVRCPRSTSNITAPALFRSIEKFTPTILFDETDASFKGDPDLQQAIRGILNAGAKEGGCVTRVVGQGKDLDVRDFNVYCAKALAGIGYLPDTVADRSIILRIQRKAKRIKLTKIKARRFRKITEPLRLRLESWTARICPAIDGVEPEMPEGLDDRKEDGAEVLFAIADEAGGDWPEKARKALLQVVGASQDEDDYRVQLLSDIQTILGDVSEEVVTSSFLVETLRKMEERPWSTWGKQGLTPHALGKMLGEFELHTGQHWQDGRKIRGYPVPGFTPAFSSYLGSEPVGAVEPASTLSETHFSPCGSEPITTACEKSEIASKHELPTASTALKGGKGTMGSQEENKDRGLEEFWLDPGVPAGEWFASRTGSVDRDARIPDTEQFDLAAMMLVRARLAKGYSVAGPLLEQYCRWTGQTVPKTASPSPSRLRGTETARAVLRPHVTEGQTDGRR